MAKSQIIAKLKHLLIAKANELGDEGATARTITSEVIREHPGTIEEVKEYLLEIAMGRLLSRARLKPPSSVEPTQLTLWSKFNVPPQIIVRRDDGEALHKNLDACTIDEAEEYVRALPTAKPKSSRKEALNEMLKALKPFSKSGTDKVGACWESLLLSIAKKEA